MAEFGRKFVYRYYSIRRHFTQNAHAQTNHARDPADASASMQWHGWFPGALPCDQCVVGSAGLAQIAQINWAGATQKCAHAA